MNDNENLIEEMEDEDEVEDDEELSRLIEQYHRDSDHYLKIFKQDLLESGLTDKTIRTHINNMYFYLNDYLADYAGVSMPKGPEYIDSFIRHFFIRKCMWATKTSINENCSTFKKFYKSMYQHGLVERLDYECVVEIIKENKKEWLEQLKRFDEGALYDDYLPW